MPEAGRTEMDDAGSRTRGGTWWQAACLAMALAVAAPACFSETPEPTPNLILVTVDTLRADHLDAYGYARPTAPTLSRIATTGVRFSHAVSSAPWTLPSMATVHSSLYPSQHGAVGAETALPDAAQTLAEGLRSHGYRTVAVVSHEFVGSRHGFDQGFDVFDESNVRGHEAVTSRDLTLTALDRLSEVEQPFFLWVHYFDPHFSYVRHPEIGFADGYTGDLPDALTSGLLTQRERGPVTDADLDFVTAVYDEEIAHTADWIDRLWEALGTRYGEENNVLALTADHGEYFLERGRFFHGKDVYDELVRVPLILAGAIPGALRGVVSDQPVSTRSIARTFMGLVGAPSDLFEGVDLLDVAGGASPEPVYTEGSYAFGADERKLAVIEAGWKLIHRRDDDGYELYDTTADPGERDDRWGRAADVDGRVERLRRLLATFQELPRLAPQAVGLSPEAIERLRALGYIR